MRYSRPSALSPTLDWTNAPLEFRFMCNLEMFSKLGGPTIGEIVRYRNRPEYCLLWRT